MHANMYVCTYGCLFLSPIPGAPFNYSLAVLTASLARMTSQTVGKWMAAQEADDHNEDTQRTPVSKQ